MSCPQRIHGLDYRFDFRRSLMSGLHYLGKGGSLGEERRLAGNGA